MVSLEEVQAAAQRVGASVRYTYKRGVHDLRLKLRRTWDWEGSSFELPELCRRALRWLTERLT